MNYTDLNDLIEQFREMIEDDSPQKGYWGKLWGLSKAIGQGFKGTRFPTLADKNEAWNTFQGLREKAHERSNAQREKISQANAQWERRKEQSERALNKISWQASQARPLTDLERSIGDILFAPLILAERILNDILGIDSEESLFSVKKELQACNEQLQKAWSTFNDYKDSMIGSDKAEAFATLSQAKIKLDEAWAEWKGASQRMFQAKQEAWEQRQREREAKRQEFVERVEANIAKLEEKLDKARNALSHQESHLEELKEKLDNAWSDSFRDRCSTWIDECEEKIRDITESIERMEGWVEEEKAKLR